MTTNGKRNKVAGSNWELESVKKLKAIGYNVGTSRLISRQRDNEKIDICNFDEDTDGRLPYNIQCKTLSTTAPYPKLLAEIPKVNGVVNMIWHKQTKQVNGRFMPRGEFACLYLEDLVGLLEQRDSLKKGFDMLHEYWDCIPDEDKIEVNDKLKELKL